VSSSIGHENAGSNGKTSTSVYYGKAPLLDRFGQAPFSGQYIVLKFDARKQDVITHGLGIYVLKNWRTKPKVLRDDTWTRDKNGTETNDRTRTGKMRDSRSKASPPMSFRSRTTDSSDIPLQWIRLENISLQAGQQTDFKMIRGKEAADLPSTSQVQVWP
jgi:hypothetical protein